MKTAIEYLAYGEEKEIEIDGKYIKTLTRAIEGRVSYADAELLMLTDDSEKKSKVRILYAENASMSEPAFGNINTYTHNNNANLIDIISFKYVKYDITRTGVIIVAKAGEGDLISELSKEFK